MKPRFAFLLFLVLVTSAVNLAQADSESDGTAAEKAGKYREALDHYIQALQTAQPGSAQDTGLREKIINLARRLKPAPVVPETAERHMARGRAALRGAASEADYAVAADELSAAAKLAPWVPELYYDLGLVLDKAGRYDEAIRHLKLYLAADPQAKDAREVRNQIYEIEFRKEKAAKAAEHKARERSKHQALSGAWSGYFWSPNNWSEKPDWSGSGWNEYGRLSSASVQLEGQNIEIRAIVRVSGFQNTFRGKLDGNRIVGMLTVRAPARDETCPNWSHDFPFEGAVDFAGNRILLIAKGGVSATQRGCEPAYDRYTLSNLLVRP